VVIGGGVVLFRAPAGEITPELYRLLDDLSVEYGQKDLRATTRQCFQIHGILKGDLRTVIKSLMEIGSSTVGVRLDTGLGDSSGFKIGLISPSLLMLYSSRALTGGLKGLCGWTFVSHRRAATW
jgi:hypothetical protein